MDISCVSGYWYYHKPERKKNGTAGRFLGFFQGIRFPRVFTDHPDDPEKMVDG